MADEKHNLKKIKTILITAVITAAIILLGVFVFFKTLPVRLSNVIRICKIIDKSYVGEYSPEKVEKGMINAIIGNIDDKYAAYYDEENAKETMQKIDGYYIGIGVEIFANTEKNSIEVISAYKDSPAYRAGIKSGDLITKIDGKKYNAASMADASSYMTGVNIKNPMDKEISITVLRGEKIIDYKLKREKIKLYRVESEIIDEVCYIDYSGFTKDSAKEMKQLLDTLDAKKIKGIVIDVRNNPGGEFYSAIDMCDHFLENKTIMYTVDKTGKKTVYEAKERQCDLPMAVLVDATSASASEIFAGSLQANKRAVIVGKKTYGKGVSQTVRYINPLRPSMGAIKITTCKNYTPDGKWINEGITPDINIEEPQADNIAEDAAFIAAVKNIKKEK